mgnify:CR=1 FL=1
MYENKSQEEIIIDLCKRIAVLEEEQKKDKAQLAFLTGFIKGLDEKFSNETNC